MLSPSVIRLIRLLILNDTLAMTYVYRKRWHLLIKGQLKKSASGGGGTDGWMG